jgi:diguanylate cyclase (GGDEF)-like protein
MRLRILGRDDPVLFGGLAFALLVVFQRSIQQVLNGAREIEQTYGVALTPALLILAVMFVFHQYAKRREMKAEATVAAQEAALARARAAEMEQLMLFGQELTRSLSIDGLRETVWRRLPALADGAGAWLVLRTGAGWERVTDCDGQQWAPGEIERIADAAATRPLADQERTDGVVCDGHVCFVMLANTRPVGVLALSPGARAHQVRKTMGAAAVLLAIAVRNAQLFADVRDRSVKDALTGCVNRAHGFEILEGELARARRAGAPLSVLLFDLDRFKDINDRHGHLIGDTVLSTVGERMQHVLRRSDVRCRYGGDEFLVVLPDTSAAGAEHVAELLRGELARVQPAASGQRLTITISAGVATSLGGDLTAAGLLERADAALYRAKKAGRNTVRSGASFEAGALACTPPARAALPS